MNCPICGANMTEFEKKTFDNRCADCHSDVWAAKNIGEKQSIEQVENRQPNLLSLEAFPLAGGLPWVGLSPGLRSPLELPLNGHGKRAELLHVD